jgi:hypothetical protein
MCLDTSWPAELHCAVAQPPVAAATLPLEATPKTMTKIMRRMYARARNAALRNYMIVERGPAPCRPDARRVKLRRHVHRFTARAIGATGATGATGKHSAPNRPAYAV